MLNKRAVFNEKVKPIIEELNRTCYNEGIPFFCSCAIADDGNSTTYVNEMISAGVLKETLSEDKLVQFIHVLRGYIPMAPQDIDEVEY